MSEVIQNLFEDLVVSENTSKLQELLRQIYDYTENTKNALLIHNTIDFLEKLLRRIFQKEKLLVFINQEENTIKLQDLANHRHIRKADLYGVYLRVLEFLQSEKTSHYKLEFERKKLYDTLVRETLLTQSCFAKFCAELLESNSIEEYTELVNSLFSFPAKITNFLETCPKELKPETFYISFLHYSIQIQDSLREKRIEHYIYILNKIILNGQSKQLVNYWFQNFSNMKEKTFEEDFLTITMTKNSGKIMNYYKIIREIVMLLSKTEHQSLGFRLLSSALIHFFEKVEKSNFTFSYLPKLLNDKYFNLNAGKLLVSLIEHYFQNAGDKKDYDILQKAIESAFVLWSDQNFVKKASAMHLKMLTNFLRALIEKAPKEYLQSPEIVEFIQQGVTNRLSENISSQLHRKCGESVWTAYLKNLGLPETIEIMKKEGLYDAEMTEEEGDILKEAVEKEPEILTFEQQKQPEEKKSILIKANDSDSDDEFISIQQPVEEESLLTLKRPKHLYDCLLGLRSENKDRVEYSLKYLNYLIRKNLGDVEFLAEDLALTLCKITNYFNWDKFEEYRNRALVSLAIMIPDVISNCLIKRFFHSECSLGEKITLLGVLERAARELSDNPEKYNPELYNEYNEQQDFYFKPVTIKYYTEEEKRKQEIENEKKEKIEAKSRRWGETKRKNEKKTMDPERLKTMNSKELLVINSSSQQIFISRFSSLCNHFFFPLAVPLREKKRFLLKEPILLSRVISWMKTYLHCAKNAPTFYNILEEVLDFLIAFINIDDTAAVAELFTCFYVISTILNKNVVLYYNNIVQKLLLLMKLISGMKDKNEKYKILIYEISNNIQKLFELDFVSNI